MATATTEFPPDFANEVKELNDAARQTERLRVQMRDRVRNVVDDPGRSAT